MRLIDADAYAAEMKKRQDACMEAMENASYDGEQFSPKEHWEGVLAAFAEAKLTLDDMQTVGGWISVENKLPEKNGDYLVVTSFFDRRRIEVLTFVQDLEKLDSYDFHGKRRPGFADYNSEYGFSERKVSHWMPLPEPPKEDGTEC